MLMWVMVGVRQSEREKRGWVGGWRGRIGNVVTDSRCVHSSRTACMNECLSDVSNYPSVSKDLSKLQSFLLAILSIPRPFHLGYRLFFLARDT